MTVNGDATAASAQQETLDNHTQAAVGTLARWLRLIFLLPLLIILLLSGYTYYLSVRLGAVEMNTKRLDVLNQATVVDRYLRADSNFGWAIKEYERLSGELPDPYILTRLGGLYVGIGDYEKATATLLRAKSSDRKNWEPPSLLNVVYSEQKKEPEAIREGEAALVLNDHDAQSLNNLAWLYATANDPALRNLEKALQYASRAVKLTGSRNSEYLDTLAEVHSRRGSADLAEQTIDHALKNERRKLVYLEEQKRKFKSAAGQR
jgi:tetratricopeptide (TPR) repeat protein